MTIVTTSGQKRTFIQESWSKDRGEKNKEAIFPTRIWADEKDPPYLLKTMVASDFRVIDGIPTAMKVVMHNENDNTQTEMELLEVKYNITLSDAMFTERSLKK